MYPADNFHDESDRQMQMDRAREQDEASRKRYRSERRDRSFVRRALRRGVPTPEIEERLLATTEFHLLNPGRDPVAYVRGLLDEESGGLRNTNIQDLAVSEPTARRTDLPAVGSRGRKHAAESEETARRYIRENFLPNDWLAVVVRNRETGETVQRVTTAEQMSTPEFQSWLRYKSAHGSDIYMSLNTLVEHAHGRTKADVKDVRHLYLDLDEGGRNRLAQVYSDAAVPPPNYVLETSRDKYQVVWRVEGISPNDAEELLRSLAHQFGGDPAATDVTRVFRLPGFNNKKYTPDFAVRLAIAARPDPVYQRTDFRVELVSRETQSLALKQAAPARNAFEARGGTQSERDWAYAIRHISRGDNPEHIVRQIAAYRAVDRFDPEDPRKLVAPRKPNPRYYAEHTVNRAMEHLGMTGQRTQQASEPGDTSSRDIEPPR